MILHPSLTPEKIYRAAKRQMFSDSGSLGYCIACGRKAKGFVEPDAREYPCQYKSCGQSTVYGAEELLLMTVA